MKGKSKTQEAKNERQNKEDIKKLVTARIRAASGDLEISVGGPAGITKEELIESVLKEDSLGREVIDVQMQYLRDMAQGKFYQFENATGNET